MKKLLYLALFFGSCFVQCKERKEVGPAGVIKEIDVIEFSVPGVESENITVGKDIIVINLPENYTGGDYIKPYIRLGREYTTNSDLVNGFSYQNKKPVLLLESASLGSRSYTICVIPFKAIQLGETPKNYKITLGPDAGIAASISLYGTAVTVNDSGKIVESPMVVLTDKITGASQQFFTDVTYVNGGNQLNVQIPATVVPGEYSANVVWGTKSELLSSQFSIVAGPLHIMRQSWYMLPNSKYFEVVGYNISKNSKYEVTIENDFVKNRKIQLSYKDAGTLTGNVPADLPTGNYKAIYQADGKVTEITDSQTGLQKYMGDDSFYIRGYTTQPIVKIISQPSARKFFQTSLGITLDYYVSAPKVLRSQPLIVNMQRSGAFEAKNDLVLVNLQTKKEYTLAYSGDVYAIFDGFMVFLAYNIPDSIPAGNYATYVIIGAKNEKSEKYSQILAIQ